MDKAVRAYAKAPAKAIEPGMFKSRTSVYDTSLCTVKAAYLIGDSPRIDESMHVLTIHRYNAFRQCDYMSAVFAYDHMRLIYTEFFFSLYIDCRKRLFSRCFEDKHLGVLIHN